MHRLKHTHMLASHFAFGLVSTVVLLLAVMVDLTLRAQYPVSAETVSFGLA